MSLILADTSVWVDLFSRKPTLSIDTSQLSLLATCPPVVQEVLQGIGEAKILRFVQASLLALHLLPTGGVQVSTYLHAADIYRNGRKRGFTVRSSVDCLIAAIAIEADLPIWHRDRDFDAISQFTDLRALREIEI